ncbi:PAS domain-containing protein [Ancylobacter terrae]|uniref:PAS domain-containing protein n=1 Tax=Ancylobacter sp. sgz301288 TaxID=3342077 RepID=UPI003860004B
MASSIDFAALVAAIGDAVVVSDENGDITYWNAAAERIFGFGPAEAMGQSLDIIIPERQRARHWEGYRHTLQTGETRYGTQVLRVPALHKDGRTLSIAFTVALLPGAIVAVVRDDTARWNEERDLRRRLRELEAGKG